MLFDLFNCHLFLALIAVKNVEFINIKLVKIDYIYPTLNVLNLSKR